MRKKLWSINFLFLIFFISNGYAGGGYSLLPKGTIKGMCVKYNDASFIDITSGYCEANGKYYEVESTTTYEVDVNDIIGGKFTYVYIDDSGSNSITPSIMSTDDIPSWSDDKQGWYRKWTNDSKSTIVDDEDQNDRCIGVIFCETDYSIMKFDSVIEGNNVRVNTSKKIIRLLSGASGVGTWSSLNTHSDFVPENAVKSILFGEVQQANGICQIHLSSDELKAFYNGVGARGYLITDAIGAVVLGESRNIAWYTESDDHTVIIEVRGFVYTR